MNIEYVQPGNVFNELNKEQFIYQRSQFLNRNPEDNIKFQLLTFNVAETQQIQRQILQNLIVGGNDIYVICLQEVSMKASSILMSDAKQTKYWIEAFTQAITVANSNQQMQNEVFLSYHQVTKQLGGLLMMVFYNNKIKIETINDVSCGFLGGLIANKGGIYVIAQYKSARILFVGCHLSADRSPSGFMQRTTNLKDILNAVLQNEHLQKKSVKKISRGVLPAITYLYNQSIQNATQTLPEYKLTAWNDALSSFEAVFILGDLNYRVQLSLQHSYSLITNQEYSRLLDFDELTWLRNGSNNYQYVDEEDPSKSIIPKQNKQVNDQTSNQQNVRQDIEQQSDYTSTSNFINDIFNIKDRTSSLEAQSLPITSVSSPISDLSMQTPITTTTQDYNKHYVISTSDHAKNISKFYQQQQNQIFYIQVAQNPLISTFLESQIQFPPTYKIKNGQYSQKRAPSYCDRILYVINNDSITLAVQNYFSNFDINISDHKPVYLVGQLNGFSDQQPSQQHIATAEQEWNRALQIFKPDIQLISNSDITIECLNFGEMVTCPIVLQNNHEFCNVTMEIESNQQFISFPNQKIILSFKQQTTINTNIQILNSKIQACNAIIKIRSVNGMINFTVNINIKNINRQILYSQNQLNALLNIGQVMLQALSQPVSKQAQPRINYFYQQLNNDFQQEATQNTLFDVYHTLNNYLANAELLSAQQIEILDNLISNKLITDAEDFKIYTQQYLPLPQYEIITYAMKLNIYLKQMLQQQNICMPDIQLIRFQNQKTQKIFDKILQ